MDSDKKKPLAGQQSETQNIDQLQQVPAESDGPPPEFYGPKGPEPTRYGDWEQKAGVQILIYIDIGGGIPREINCWH